MAVINFFEITEKEIAAKVMANYFELKAEDVFFELSNTSHDNYEALDFIKRFSIDLNCAYQEVTKISCRHLTTSDDQLDSIFQRGMLNLKQMLEQATSLRAFLLNHGVEINVDEAWISYDGKRYPIYKYNSKERDCFINPANDCNEYGNCGYCDANTALHGKLYFDKCEIEAFLDADIKEIEGYSTVSHSPEILLTIENLIKYYTSKKPLLQDGWRNRPNNCGYILEFDVAIEAFEPMTTRSYGNYWNIQELAEMMGYNEWDFEDNLIKPEFTNNLFLIQNLLNKFYGFRAREFGQILPQTIIPGDAIRVIKEKPILVY
ncbi:hypothetical protein LXM56_15825 [Lysinibacillus fusiformis]|uniref:hypothetical protein n=1 Tax=Lysinibacillus fusiformis TaxID=28031 RepID=UPI001E2B8281|nr:hypothetical protein [Lysinibacillus fusiformis]MCE4045583.1 hypothetical protein [Lysinibacillus fusiformis]